jgi:hypothetical protein
MTGCVYGSFMIENMGSAGGACINNTGGSSANYNPQNLWPCIEVVASSGMVRP